ncbi:MAG: hypothetical protein ACR2J4_04355, partial [Deinococcus sp.]
FEMSAIRNDNSPRRVGNLIESAYKQLATRPEAKIVILFNTANLDVWDLKEALDGYLDFRASDLIIRNSKSEWIASRIRGIVKMLDGIIWIDKKRDFFQFFANTAEGIAIANRYFSHRLGN